MLDLDTIKAWAMILRLTVAEYLGLDPDISSTVHKRNVTELVSSPGLIVSQELM